VRYARDSLLRGPYQVPAVRVGDRVECEFRGCECVVTSLSAGRIQWPRGRVANAEVARRIGRSPSAVSQRRTAREIPTFRDGWRE
jgi:hypothetical protein